MYRLIILSAMLAMARCETPDYETTERILEELRTAITKISNVSTKVSEHQANFLRILAQLKFLEAKLENSKTHLVQDLILVGFVVACFTFLFNIIGILLTSLANYFVQSKFSKPQNISRKMKVDREDHPSPADLARLPECRRHAR